jgi:acyl-CoA oxidase
MGNVVPVRTVVAGAERCTDPSARALLETVCDLYALSTVEADQGCFLEHGRLTPARSEASGPR